MECIFLGCVTHMVHDLVPVLAGEDLEDGEHGDGEGVEVGGRVAVREAEGAAEELHAEQRRDQDEEEEQQQQRDDGLHRGDEGHQQVAQGRPVPAEGEEGEIQFRGLIAAGAVGV